MKAVKGKPTVKEAWEVLKTNFEWRSRMITIELWKWLHNTHCAENGNVRTHFDAIHTMREKLTSLGTMISESDFSAIILGSLPKSYDQFLLAVIATASVLKRDLEPEDLMQTINDCQSTRPGATKEESADATFFTGNNNWGKTTTNLKKSDKEIVLKECSFFYLILS